MISIVTRTTLWRAVFVIALVTWAIPGATADDAVPAPPPGMVYVPAGSFIMGSEVGDADERPKHLAETGAYFIDRFEVSNADFKRYDATFAYKEGQDNHPAIVTWQQAAAYAAWAGKRLPTEEEWEKAARGIDGRTFPWGESYDPSFHTWDETYPRGGSQARPESPYGCIDMAGGAWEWTADWYRPYAGNEVPCDAFGDQYKVLRGGASFNGRAMVRTTHRYYLPPDTTGGYFVGFRCVQEARLEAGGWRLEARGWRLEAVGCRL